MNADMVLGICFGICYLAFIYAVCFLVIRYSSNKDTQQLKEQIVNLAEEIKLIKAKSKHLRPFVQKIINLINCSSSQQWGTDKRTITFGDCSIQIIGSSIYFRHKGSSRISTLANEIEAIQEALICKGFQTEVQKTLEQCIDKHLQPSSPTKEISDRLAKTEKYPI